MLPGRLPDEPDCYEGGLSPRPNNHSLRPSAKPLRKDSDPTLGSWKRRPHVRGSPSWATALSPQCVDRRTGGTVPAVCCRFGTGFCAF